MRQINRDAAIWCCVGLVAVILAGTYAVEHPGQLSLLSAVQILETAVTIVTIVAGAFVGFAWRWPLFRGWLVRVPYLGGTWRGSITPLHRVMGEVKAAAPIPATLVIRQWLFLVRATLHTSGMDSRSFSGEVFLDEESSEKRLVYSYSTNPALQTRETNPRHDGTALLALHSHPHRLLKGNYWTDRLTRGEVEVMYAGRSHDVAVVPL